MKIKVGKGSGWRTKRSYNCAVIILPQKPQYFKSDALVVANGRGILFSKEQRQLRQEGKPSYYTSTLYDPLAGDTFLFTTRKAFWRKFNKLKPYLPDGATIELVGPANYFADMTISRQTPPQVFCPLLTPSPAFSQLHPSDEHFNALVRLLRAENYVVEVRSEPMYRDPTGDKMWVASVWGKGLTGSFIKSSPHVYNVYLDGQLSVDWESHFDKWSKCPLRLPIPENEHELHVMRQMLDRLATPDGKERSRTYNYRVRTYDDPFDGIASYFPPRISLLHDRS